MKYKLTAAEVRELVMYDPSTGIFTWAKARRNARPGEMAGHITPRGYLYMSLNDHAYVGHRVAWLYMTGAWPIGVVDHRNGIKSDNRWQNLRDASATENAQNVRSATRRNKLGFLGVIPPQGRRTQFKASIQVNGKSIHLGYHKTPELAHAAYIEAKRSLHAGNTL